MSGSRKTLGLSRSHVILKNSKEISDIKHGNDKLKNWLNANVDNCEATTNDKTEVKDNLIKNKTGFFKYVDGDQFTLAGTKLCFM